LTLPASTVGESANDRVIRLGDETLVSGALYSSA
jgi:hypothetical protein